MKVHREKDGTFVVSLMRGETIRASIETLAVKEGIVGAQVSGIGAVEDPELGYYMLDKKEYAHHIFPGIFELLSFDGNVTLRDDRPFLHTHPIISGPDLKAFGGHFFDARVGVVVELFLTPLATPLRRIMCDEIGLARWEPGE